MHRITEEHNVNTLVWQQHAKVTTDICVRENWEACDSRSHGSDCIETTVKITSSLSLMNRGHLGTRRRRRSGQSANSHAPRSVIHQTKDAIHQRHQTDVQSASLIYGKLLSFRALCILQLSDRKLSRWCGQFLHSSLSVTPVIFWISFCLLAV